MPISEEQLEREVLNKRIHFWNRIYRLALVLLLCLAIGIQLSSNLKLNTTTQAIKIQQESVQVQTLEARKANARRQQDLQDYIKCLSVLRFDFPASQLQTKAGVIKALDSCAAKE